MLKQNKLLKANEVKEKIKKGEEIPEEVKEKLIKEFAFDGLEEKQTTNEEIIKNAKLVSLEEDEYEEIEIPICEIKGEIDFRYKRDAMWYYAYKLTTREKVEIDVYILKECEELIKQKEKNNQIQSYLGIFEYEEIFKIMQIKQKDGSIIELEQEQEQEEQELEELEEKISKEERDVGSILSSYMSTKEVLTMIRKMKEIGYISYDFFEGEIIIRPKEIINSDYEEINNEQEQEETEEDLGVIIEENIIKMYETII